MQTKRHSVHPRSRRRSIGVFGSVRPKVLRAPALSVPRLRLFATFIISLHFALPSCELREQIESRYTGAMHRPGETREIGLDDLNIVIEMAWVPAGVFTMGGDQSPEEVARLGGGQADWFEGGQAD